MKIKILSILLMLNGISMSCHSQQQPFYSQYILNPFVSNPALAGIENYWDVKLSYRNQWQGIEGSPQTTYFTMQGSRKKMIYSKPTTGTVPPPDTRKNVRANYAQKYKPIIPHAGMGLIFYNDKTGPLSRYVIDASYAYHIGLSSKTSISAGISGGIQGVNLDTEKLNFGTSNPSDPSVFANGVVKYIRPDLNVGLWLYSAFYFVGASAQNLIPIKTDYGEAIDDQVILPHFTLSAGYKVLLNDKMSFLPSTMIRFVDQAPVNFDVNAKLQYRDLMWVGVSYRNVNTFAAMLGMNVNSTLNFAYAYDISNSRLGDASHGTHEILIGFLFANHHRVLCPRDFW
ncbi:MAG: type IX secretion system membrane protein PorP/SprF [Chryseolinea sp.]